MILEYLVRVLCDGAGCREKVMLFLPPGHEVEAQAVKAAVKSEGWTVARDDEHYCQVCASSPVR